MRCREWSELASKVRVHYYFDDHGEDVLNVNHCDMSGRVHPQSLLQFLS